MGDISLKEPRLLDRNTMSNYEDAYNIVMHKSGPLDAYFMHYHDYYEISFYLGREPGVYLIDQKEYRVLRGDIIVCDLFQPHMLKCKNNVGHERFNIGLDPRILLSYSSRNANLLEIFEQKSENYPVLHMDIWQFPKYMNVINGFQTIDMKYGKELRDRALIYQILAYLYEDGYEENNRTSIGAKHVKLLSKLIHYIETHLDTPIPLETLSEVTNYSVAHICRVFKEETNDTLVHYMLEKRLQKAKYLLMGTMPIAEIAEATGFNSYSYFFRAFKKAYGMGPEKWRHGIGIKD